MQHQANPTASPWLSFPICKMRVIALIYFAIIVFTAPAELDVNSFFC